MSVTDKESSIGLLLAGFHPDPSVVRTADGYVMVTSTFEYLPGVPVYRSDDLVDWDLIGHVIDRADLIADDVSTGGGVWAPTIRYHDGRFYVILTDAKGGRGTLLFSAADAAGPWGDPLSIDVDGIDPDLAWDAEGTCYVTYAALRFRPTFHHLGIEQVRIDLETGEVLEDPRPLWSGSGLKIPEAPHLYAIGEWWYLLIAEGGTDHGHSVSIARGPSPEGPFEGCPSNPIFSARSTEWPVQNTGHGDLVLAPNGTWRMVYLGTRNHGRGFSPLGRETFITTVDWVDGWPSVKPASIGAHASAFVDDFDAAVLGGDWIGVRRLPSEFVDITRGQIRLTGQGHTMGSRTPTFVGRRVSTVHANIQLEIVSRAGVGGLSIRIDETHHYDVEVAGSTLTARACAATMVDERSIEICDGPIVLFAESRPPGRTAGMSSDIITLGYIDDAGRHEVATFDGRYLTTETACAFTGRVAGPYVVTGRFEFGTYTETPS